MNNTISSFAGWVDKLDQIFLNTGMSVTITTFLRTFLIAIVIFGLAILADYITKKIILIGIKNLVRRSKSHLDDILVKRRVFNKLAHIVPALLIYYTTNFIFKDYIIIEAVFEKASLIYIIIIAILAIDSFINALLEIYMTLPISEGRPIKGYIQVVKIIFYFIGVILVISIIFGESPKVLLAGLGAVAAVLMLVFKDTILGFVASIQLSGNKMVAPGDWIEMPSHKADGDVIDISLNTVKVRNWDKTITTIPTYALVSESFRNWKGMEESGGRRIKRSINIDMNSIKFLDKELAEKLKKIHLLKDYIETRQEEIRRYNQENQIDDSVLVNGRRMTNLGTFRIYIEQYLKQHPKVHKELTMLVRHLQPTATGLPIEIYVFSNDQAWAKYEAIQANIFDHILAVIPEFELGVFQNPTGGDFQILAEK
ncbi:mechanosensitive ion channel family protein [Bacteroidota bacterium]